MTLLRMDNVLLVVDDLKASRSERPENDGRNPCRGRTGGGVDHHNGQTDCSATMRTRRAGSSGSGDGG